MTKERHEALSAKAAEARDLHEEIDEAMRVADRWQQRAERLLAERDAARTDYAEQVSVNDALRVEKQRLEDQARIMLNQMTDLSLREQRLQEALRWVERTTDDGLIREAVREALGSEETP